MKPIYIFLICFLIIDSAYSQSGWIIKKVSTKECLSVSFPSKDTGYISQKNGGLLKTVDGGISWNNINTMIMFMGKLRFNSPLFGYIFGLPSIITSNGGLNWLNMNINNITGIGMTSQTDFFFNSFDVGFLAGGDLYPMPIPCCYDGTIYKTTNSGLNWMEQYRITGDIYKEIFFKDESNGVVLDQILLIRTSDGGISWVRDNSFIYTIPYFFAESMSNPYKDTIFLAGNFIQSGNFRGGIIKSTNNGVSWDTTFYMPYYSRFRKIQFIDNNTGHAVGDTGLIVRTTNGGANWLIINSGTRKRINDVAFINEDTGFVVGDSGLVMKTFTGGLTSTLSQNINIPEKYMLSQNYPNPFNPKTIIKYQCSMISDVQLNVYDIVGNDIVTLVNERQNAGYYSVEFDGSNLPSGIYFYKLTTSDNFTAVKKMIILK